MGKKNINTARWAPLLLNCNSSNSNLLEICSLDDLEDYLTSNAATISKIQNIDLVIYPTNGDLRITDLENIQTRLQEQNIKLASICFFTKNNFYIKGIPSRLRSLFAGKSGGLFTSDVRKHLKRLSIKSSTEYWPIFGAEELRWLIPDIKGQHTQHLLRRSAFNIYGKIDTKSLYSIFIRLGGYKLLEPWKFICVSTLN